MNVLKINKLQHIGIPVSNLIRSESFYKSLGFKRVMNASFLSDGETGNCLMMQNGEVLIELYQLPESQLMQIRNRKDGHIDHIAFDVDDIDTAFALLKASSFHILEETPMQLSFWSNGCKYFNIVGPDGERLEFNQILLR